MSAASEPVDVTVRAIRPHDTAGGWREPGATYERDATSAASLDGQGVVAIIPAPRAKRTAK